MAVEYEWTRDDLDQLAPHVYLPLREALRSCQIDPPSDWPPSAYTLIRRTDMARQRGQTFDRDGQVRGAPPQVTTVSIRRLGAPKRPLRISDEHATGAKARSATRFNEDRRLEEVARMLRFDAPCVISSGDRSLYVLFSTFTRHATIILTSNARPVY